MGNNKFYIQETQGYSVDAIAAYMVLKKAHSNSVFYKSSPSYIAKHTGQCVNTAKKLIKLVIQSGLAAINDKGHLVLVSKHFLSGERADKQRRTRGYFFINSTKYKDVKKEYRKILLKDKLKQMQFASLTKPDTNITGALSKSKEKRARKLQISSRKLGKILQLSPMHANRTIKQFVKEVKGRVKKGKIRKEWKEYYKFQPMIKMFQGEIKVKDCNTYYLPSLIGELSITNPDSNSWKRVKSNLNKATLISSSIM
jgi:hypothetical protein